MSNRTLLSCALASALLSLPCVGSAQELAPQLLGVWKRTSFVQKELATGRIEKPFGETPVGTAFFTVSGHFAWFIVPGGFKVDHSARLAFYSAAVHGSGNYTVEGNSVILKYSVASNPTWRGTERKVEMQVSGRMLTWTSAPYQSMDGKDLVGIATFERME